MVKGFGMTVDYVLYDLSYANLVLYSSTLPSYDSDKNEKKGEGEENGKYNMDDVSNNDMIEKLFQNEIR